MKKYYSDREKYYSDREKYYSDKKTAEKDIIDIYGVIEDQIPTLSTHKGGVRREWYYTNDGGMVLIHQEIDTNGIIFYYCTKKDGKIERVFIVDKDYQERKEMGMIPFLFLLGTIAVLLDRLGFSHGDIVIILMLILILEHITYS